MTHSPKSKSFLAMKVRSQPPRKRKHAQQAQRVKVERQRNQVRKLILMKPPYDDTTQAGKVTVNSNRDKGGTESKGKKQKESGMRINSTGIWLTQTIQHNEWTLTPIKTPPIKSHSE